jgi:hypothetical protein
LLLFENLLRHFQNTDSVGTEAKEAAYAITGENVKIDWRFFSCRCWSIDQEPKLTACLPIAKIILFKRFACWSKDQHGL